MHRKRARHRRSPKSPLAVRGASADRLRPPLGVGSELLWWGTPRAAIRPAGPHDPRRIPDAPAGHANRHDEFRSIAAHRIH